MPDVDHFRPVISIEGDFNKYLYYVYLPFLKLRPVFDGQAISCLGHRICAVSVGLSPNLANVFLEKYQVFFFYKNFFKGSMHRRLGGRIDSPHFWRACPEDLDREMAWPSLSLRVYSSLH